MASSAQPFGSRSYKLPDRSVNANAMPFSASSFTRRGLGTTATGDFHGEGGPKAAQHSAPPAPQGPSQDTNPLSRLTEDQREEINEAVFSPSLPFHSLPSFNSFTLRMFTLFDLDRDRHLDYHELRVAFRALGFTLSKQELISLLTTYGVPRPQVQQQQQSQSGAAPQPPQPSSKATSAPTHPSNLLMPHTAFQTVTALKILERDPRDEILRAFELFDEGGKGFIDLEDLRRVARELGETGLEEEELRAMIEEFDLEGVGGVTREAFVGICWQ
ncbi:Cell division control protein [Aspergillus sclerotialis]|uniref:Cell division control protein n=1 Tax=Aspergillus sclerotialis TaxID=2070753 RepID=A0A3A2Z7U0_9EURO|nr:Cell division control protein [Aspergillus sclerotialis]